MEDKRKIKYIFKLWLILYRIETALWDRYSHSFYVLGKGKDFHEYHYQSSYDDKIPF